MLFLFSVRDCTCHNAYRPVCALNGMTYPNTCLAKCSNISDAELSVGDCQSINPCDPDSCARGLVCIPFRYVCLAPLSRCQQFICSSSSSGLGYL